ncbi:unnamed protein product [Amoebophrya sp. A25]|nr:unnamed protein product [Amoebophrya sp. A25]|eukprot:GSA25T00011065001.1
MFGAVGSSAASRVGAGRLSFGCSNLFSGGSVSSSSARQQQSRGIMTICGRGGTSGLAMSRRGVVSRDISATTKSLSSPLGNDKKMNTGRNTSWRPAGLQKRSFAASTDDPSHAKIKELVDKNPVLLFMKGNPIFPQCGFSRTVCEVLKREGLEGKFHSVNVLENPDIREGVKSFSDWPTIPQLYVNGEFVGGCDIVLEMHRQGELKDVLSKKA